jgi:hypothetical protein
VQLFYGGGGRDFAFSLLPYSPPPSAVVLPALSVTGSFIFPSFFPLSRGAAVLPSPVHLDPHGCPPLAMLHSLLTCHSWSFSGAQIRISQSPICHDPFFRCSDAPLQHLHRPPSFLLLPHPVTTRHCVFSELFIVFCSSFPILLLFCFVGCCLIVFSCFDLAMETFVTEIVLVPLFHAVPTLDYDSAYLASAFL